MQQLDQLIRHKKTGNAELLAEKLGISRRQVYNWIDEIRAQGLKIEYDREIQSFVYTDDSHLYIKVKVKKQ